ncbi:MAG: ABC transporter ATP-binding protein [Ruminococcaceae bacterium]|nr:ABC transporter ATP-binding protein [Oscillospiraceae bacterium]
MIKKLFGAVGKYKFQTILTLIFMTGEAVIETLIPFITANLVNKVARGALIDEILKTGGFLAIAACISLAFGGMAAFTAAKASSGFAKNLRGMLFRKVQSYSFHNIDKFSSSSLVTRMTTDVANVQMSFMMIIRTAVRSPLMLIFSVIMAYVMGGALATAFVVVIPILGVGLYLVSRKAMPAFRRVFKKYDKLNESIEENVQAMRVVKGFSREKYENDKFEKAAEDIRDDFTKAERIVAINTPLMQFCMNFNWIVILLIGSKMAILHIGGVDVGQISAMLTYGMQILMSLMMLSMIYVMITMSAESAKRIFEVLEEVPSLEEPKEPVFEVKDGSIEFNNVNFKYSKEAKRNSLSDVNLKIESGMTVGVIGGTGSGKSSLVQLIPRLYDVTEGEIKVGGIDVRNYDIKTLRDSVSMVLQKNLLFSGTIKENLRWGNENATDEEIEKACRLAQAEEFIKTFPDRYDTKIEQGGTNVSGGQKQRLCIARALLKSPKILILDDSTSAVDTKTDSLIRNGFKEFIPETTKIIIAQRVASVMEADLIIVMENGKIDNIGTHQELLQSSEIYREVYEEQTQGGDKDETSR